MCMCGKYKLSYANITHDNNIFDFSHGAAFYGGQPLMPVAQRYQPQPPPMVPPQNYGGELVFICLKKICLTFQIVDVIILTI